MTTSQTATAPTHPTEPRNEAGPLHTRGNTAATGQHPVDTHAPADAARAALAEAAAQQGFDADDAVLLHDGLNWVYRLPHNGVIGKVHARATYDEAQLQLNAAQALLAAGIPTAAPVGRLLRPITVGRVVVTFTEDLGGGKATSRHLGELLARLHHLPPLTGIGLPTTDRIGRAGHRIDALPPTAITDHEREQLRERLAHAADRYARTDWPPPCTIHGDVTPTNAVVTDQGVAALIDLESIAIGNPCVDQAMPAWAVQAFGTHPAYNQEFVTGYGYDIASAATHRYRALVPLFGISSLLSYLELSATRPDVRPEAERRLQTILERKPLPWGWKVSPPVVSRARVLPQPDRGWQGLYGLRCNSRSRKNT